MFLFRSRYDVRIASFAAALLVAASGCATKPATKPDTKPAVEKPKLKITGNFTDEPVTFEAAGMTIHGTITKPEGDGPFPALAIAAGSGPTDRDWKNPLIPGPNGSATLLAHGLARRGIVVLRYDKRGTGETGLPKTKPVTVTWPDYIAELSTALKTLAGESYVDTSKIYVGGHSEGADHALKVAENPPVKLAGVVLLSAAGRSLRDIVVWQIGNQLKASGLPPKKQKKELTAFTKAIDQIADGKHVDPSKVGSLAGIQQFIMALENPQSVGFAQALLKFDPKSAFSKIDLPVLIVQGDKDIQVDPKLDAKPLAAAAKAAGRDVTVVDAPTADHVLKKQDKPRAQLTARDAAQYNAAGRVLAPKVVPGIADWIMK